MLDLKQKRWYRNLFPSKTFVRLDEKWIRLEKYQTGDKIISVDNGCGTEAYCECGNELVHSNSFQGEVNSKNGVLFEYICSHCKKLQWWHPDIIPGLLSCNRDGIPNA